MPGSRRLSDVDEGGAAGAPGVEGALDDLLPMDDTLEGGHKAGVPPRGAWVTACTRAGHSRLQNVLLLVKALRGRPAACAPGRVTWVDKSLTCRPYKYCGVMQRCSLCHL